MPYVSHIDYKKLVEENGKRCSGPCGLKLPASAFNIARDRYDGRQGYCRACQKLKYGAKKYSPEKEKARKERFKKKHPGAQNKYSRRHKMNKRLRAQMDLNDKLYQVKPSLVGSSSGTV